MLRRELKPVTLLTYSGQTDEYGQLRQDKPSETSIEMAISLYTQNEQNTPLYNDCEAIGLTYYTSISDSNVIQDGSTKYDILHIIPSGRLIQVLLRKQK